MPSFLDMPLEDLLQGDGVTVAQPAPAARVPWSQQPVNWTRARDQFLDTPLDKLDMRGSRNEERIKKNPFDVVNDNMALPGERFEAALAAMDQRREEAKEDSSQLSLDPLYYPKKLPVVGFALSAREKMDANRSLDMIKAGIATPREYLDAARHYKMLEAQGDYTSAQRIAGGILDVGSFVGDMIVTGGISGVVKGAVAKKLGSQTLKTFVGRQSARLGGGAAGIATQAALIPQRVIDSAARRQMNQIVPNAQGGIDVLQEGKELPQALAEGYADTAVEVGTERAGRIIARYLPWLNKLRPRGSGIAGTVASRAGTEGLPIEYAEEVLADGIKGGTGLEDNYGATGQLLKGNPVPTLETLAILSPVAGVGIANNARLAPAMKARLKELQSQRAAAQKARGERQTPPDPAGFSQTSPAAAAALAAIEQPSRKQWEEAGLPPGANAGQRKAFADRVREELQPATPETKQSDPRWTTSRAENLGGAGATNMATADTVDGAINPTPPDASPLTETQPVTQPAQEIAKTGPVVNPNQGVVNPNDQEMNQPGRSTTLPGALANATDAELAAFLGQYAGVKVPVRAGQKAEAYRARLEAAANKLLEEQPQLRQAFEGQTPPATSQASQPAAQNSVAPQSSTPQSIASPATQAAMKTHLDGASNESVVKFLKNFFGLVAPARNGLSEQAYRAKLDALATQKFEEFFDKSPSVREEYDRIAKGLALGEAQTPQAPAVAPPLTPAEVADLDRMKFQPAEVATETGIPPVLVTEYEIERRAGRTSKSLTDWVAEVEARKAARVQAAQQAAAAQQPDITTGAVQTSPATQPTTSGIAQPASEAMTPAKGDAQLQTESPSVAEGQPLSEKQLYSLATAIATSGPTVRNRIAVNNPVALKQFDALLPLFKGKFDGYVPASVMAYIRSQAVIPKSATPTQETQDAPQNRKEVILNGQRQKEGRQEVLDPPAPPAPSLEETAAQGAGPVVPTNGRRKATLTQSEHSLGIAAPMIDVTGPARKLGGRVLGWLQKYMTSRGDLPADAFARATQKNGQIAAEEHAVQSHANDLRDALRKEHGSTRLTEAGQRQLNDALHGDATALASLTPAVAATVGKLREHIDRLSRRLIDSGLPGESLELTINENMGVYATRSYRVFDDPAWKDKVSPTVVESAFHHLKEVYPEETDQQIKNRIGDMLTRENAPVALVKVGKLGSKDLGITKRRQEIAPEIRALLGEYNDPFVNYARSVTKMANLVANHEFLKDVKAAGLGTYFFERSDPNRPAGYNAEFAAEGTNALAPLNGLMTTPAIKQGFQDVYARNDPSLFLQNYLRVNFGVKFAKTVLSPITHVRNYVSNYMFHLQNGHAFHPVANAGKLIEAHRTTAQELQSHLPTTARALWKTNEDRRAAVRRYVELGLIGDGVMEGELSNALKTSNSQHAELADTIPGKAHGLVKGGLKAVTTAYRLEDAVHKIVAFEAERARYQKAYEAAGQQLTDAQLDTLAASIVRDTYPTYSMVPRAVQAIRTFPLVGAFVSFPSEVVRTTYKSLTLSVRELNNPVTRSIGAQRLAGNVLALTLAATITNTGRWLLGIGDEEDKDLRQFLPEWQKDADILWTSKPKNGKATYIDLSYTMPNAGLRKPFHALTRGENVADALAKGLWTFAEPFIGEEILAGKLIDIARNKTDSGREVYPEYGTTTAQTKAKAAHIYDALEPGVFTTGKRLIKGATGHVEPWGKTYNPRHELMALATGLRPQETDAEQALFFHARQFADSKRKTTGMLSGTLGSKGTVTPQDVAAAQQASETARQGQFQKLVRSTRAALKLGVPDTKVREVLGAAGITKGETDNVINGQYQAGGISRELYERVSALPGGAERLNAYAQQSGDDNGHQYQVKAAVAKAGALLAKPPKTLTKTDRANKLTLPQKRKAIEQEAKEARRWLRTESGLSPAEVKQAVRAQIEADLTTEQGRAAKYQAFLDAMGW